MATSSKRNDEFWKACSGSEIKGLLLNIGGGLASPNAETFYFVTFRSSYPLVGCSPAEPTSVWLDDQKLTAGWDRVKDRPRARCLFHLRQRMADQLTLWCLFSLRQQDGSRSFALRCC